jgi:hypothetical protein
VPTQRERDKWSLWDKRLRDAIIFAVGIFGTMNELFIISDPRPSALIFLASLIGVPFVLQADEKKSRDGS